LRQFRHNGAPLGAVHAVPARDHGERPAAAKTRAGFGIDHADCDTRRLPAHSNKDPGARPRSSPFQCCHDWINILSILGDHRLVELLVQTGAEKMRLDLAQKKTPEFASVCWLPPPKSFAVQFLPNRSLLDEKRERSALLFV
jgi:hypothetical protein